MQTGEFQEMPNSARRKKRKQEGETSDRSDVFVHVQRHRTERYSVHYINYIKPT